MQRSTRPSDTSERKGKSPMTQTTNTQDSTPAQDDANITITQVQAKLQTLVSAMVEKGVVTPDAEFTIKANDRKPHIFLTCDYSHKVFAGEYHKCCFGNSFAECFTKAQQVIAALPDPAEAIVQEYQRKVAAAIDYGTENSLDERLVAPLRNVSKTISDGLLTDQRGATS